MRCPSCGADNLSASGSCHKCGKPLNPLRGISKPASTRADGIASASVAKPDAKPGMSYVDHRDIPLRLKFEYSHTLKDQTQRALESIQGLLAHFTKPVLDVNELMVETAEIIRKQFGIDNVAIGLKSQEDGKYRYVVNSGFREEAIQNRAKIVYTLDDFYKDGTYNGTFISKYSKIYLAEDNEYKGIERMAYNRPLLLGLRRRSLNDSLEADYIDTFILGLNDELLGWIEISGTRTGKLPDAVTIRWMETAAAIIGAAIRCDRMKRGLS